MLKQAVRNYHTTTQHAGATRACAPRSAYSRSDVAFVQIQLTLRKQIECVGREFNPVALHKKKE